MPVVLRRPCPRCTAIVELEISSIDAPRLGSVQCMSCGEYLMTHTFPGQTAPETHAVIDTDLENAKSLRSIAVSLQILAGKALVEVDEVDDFVVNDYIRAKVDPLDT